MIRNPNRYQVSENELVVPCNLDSFVLMRRGKLEVFQWHSLSSNGATNTKISESVAQHVMEWTKCVNTGSWLCRDNSPTGFCWRVNNDVVNGSSKLWMPTMYLEQCFLAVNHYNESRAVVIKQSSTNCQTLVDADTPIPLLWQIMPNLIIFTTHQFQLFACQIHATRSNDISKRFCEGMLASRRVIRDKEYLASSSDSDETAARVDDETIPPSCFFEEPLFDRLNATGASDNEAAVQQLRLDITRANQIAYSFGAAPTRVQAQVKLVPWQQKKAPDGVDPLTGMELPSKANGVGGRQSKKRDNDDQDESSTKEQEQEEEHAGPRVKRR